MIKKLKIKYMSAKNFMCFGKEGIEIDFEKFGNIIYITGTNEDVNGDSRNGVGKCFGKNTPILMYDGTIKLVQDVKIGDLVMGDDSTPRTVISLGRGNEELFKVTPYFGEPYIVNKSHILMLKNTDKTGTRKIPFKNGDVHEMSVENYLNLSKETKSFLCGYKKGVDFPSKSVKIDPYILGIWLGDHLDSIGITHKDKVITDEFINYIRSIGFKINDLGDIKYGNKIVIHNEKSSLFAAFKSYNLINNKHIPFDYKTNDFDVRMQLLSGIIDSIGEKIDSGYEIISKNKILSDDIVFIARSLGFYSYIRKYKKRGYNDCWAISISGQCNEIPLKLEYKLFHKIKLDNDPLVYKISIKSIGLGEYYGFTVDKNNLFLLGDFTVVHNSSCSEIIAYTLFGKTIKPKLNLDDVINNKTKKKLRTEVRWDNYRVVRERKPNKLSIYELDENSEWKDISEGGMPSVQKQIEDRIGINFETFVNLMVFTDNNKGSFLECDKEEKRKIIENLLSLEKYRLYWEKAKKIKNTSKEKLKVLSETYDHYVKELQYAKNRVVSIEDQQSNWKKLKEAELKSILVKIKQKKEELESTDVGNLLVEYQQAQDRIKSINNAIPEMEDKEIKARDILEVANEKLELLREQKITLSTKQQAFNALVENARSESKKTKQVINSLLAKKGTKCPTCYGVVKEENIKNVIETCQNSIDENEKIISKNEYESEQVSEKLTKCIAQIEKIKSAIGEKDLIIKEYSEKISKYKNELIKLNSIQKPETTSVEQVLEEQIAELKRQALAKDKEINSPSPYVQVLADAIIDVDKKQNLCDDHKKVMEKYEKELPYYEFWVEAFGDNGIRKYIIDGIIPALNNRIAYWLQILIDGNINLVFNETLEEKIERNPSDGDPFVYYAMSGGERRRLNLAVSQAFAHVMMLNSGTSPSLVFLDEVTTNIDPVGVQGVYKMILDLAKEKQVLVTSHDHDLIELLSGAQRINLVKKDGNTVISN